MTPLTANLKNVREPMQNPSTVHDYLAQRIAQLPAADTPFFIGLSGAQGSGKSTVVEALAQSLPGVAILGLDDFYLTLDERRALARQHSPLLATRGPPGTHDVPLLHRVLDELAAGRPVRVPQFSKPADDRGSDKTLIDFEGAPALVLLEGWLVGAIAAEDFVTGPPLNALEQQGGAQAWRAFQCDQLSGPYQLLWDRMDAFVHLAAPDFATVLRWRTEQEETNLGVARGGLAPERIRWVEDFVQYYERVTRDMLAGARRPGTVIQLDERRRLSAVTEDHWPDCG